MFVEQSLASPGPVNMVDHMVTIILGVCVRRHSSGASITYPASLQKLTLLLNIAKKFSQINLEHEYYLSFSSSFGFFVVSRLLSMLLSAHSNVR